MPQGVRRKADVPREVREQCERASKSDLIEIVHDMAGLLNDAGSCDDAASTMAKIREMLERRADRGLG